jgi:hypothetical protein
VHDLALGQHGGDLPADLLDVAVEGAVGDDSLVAVHRVDELLARVDPARVLGEDLQALGGGWSAAGAAAPAGGAI